MYHLINSLKDLIIDAGKIAIEAKRKGLAIEQKFDNTLVTNADKEIDNLICDALKTFAPSIGIISEEGGSYNLQNNNFWLIDPIDGTRSYIKNEDTYTINIGFIENGKPKLGIIYQPEKSKLYYTDTSGKFQIEEAGEMITLNKCTKNDPLVAVVGNSNLDNDLKNILDNIKIKYIKTIPSSLKLCYIAEGSADIYPNSGPKMQWDIAAGHALINASGGKILDANQQEITYSSLNTFTPWFCAYSSRLYAMQNDN